MNNLYISITAGIRIGVRCVGSIVCPSKCNLWRAEKEKMETMLPTQ